MKRNYTPLGKLLWGPKPDMSKVRSGLVDAYTRRLERTPEHLMKMAMYQAAAGAMAYAMMNLGRK